MTKPYIAILTLLTALGGATGAQAMQNEDPIPQQSVGSSVPNWEGLLQNDVYFSGVRRCGANEFWASSTDINSPIAKAFDAIKLARVWCVNKGAFHEEYRLDDMIITRTISIRPNHTVATYFLFLRQHDCRGNPMNSHAEVLPHPNGGSQIVLSGHSAHLLSRTILDMIAGYRLRDGTEVEPREFIPGYTWEPSGALYSPWLECTPEASWFENGECRLNLTRPASRVAR